MREVIRFRVETEDKEKLEATAKGLGLSVSAFLRLLIKNWSNGIKFEREKEAPVKEKG